MSGATSLPHPARLEGIWDKELGTGGLPSDRWRRFQLTILGFSVRTQSDLLDRPFKSWNGAVLRNWKVLKDVMCDISANLPTNPVTPFALLISQLLIDVALANRLD